MTTTNMVSRQTSKGLLVVSVDSAGKIVATLAGKPINSSFGQMRPAAKSPLGLVTHLVGMGDTQCGILAAEGAALDAAIATARAAYLATPAGLRAALVSALGDDGAYPGSGAWLRAERARKALAAFDLAHPEVLAGNVTEHDAEICTDGVGCGGGL